MCRACAFFINKEYSRKRGSLYPLYRAKEKLQNEIQNVTKKNAAYILRCRYKMYAAMLAEGRQRLFTLAFYKA